MKKMTLKYKLIFVTLAIVILVMLVTTTVVSMVIDRQNVDASFDRIKNALNIVREDLKATQKKVLFDSHQAGAIDEMAGKVKYLYNYKQDSDISMTQNTFREIASSLFNVCSASGLWKVAIYDSDGDLDAFTVQLSKETFVLAFPEDKNGKAQGVVLKRDENVKPDMWKSLDSLPKVNLKTKFDGPIPREDAIAFVQIDNSICVVAYVPIFADDYDKDTDKLVKRQFGFAMAIRKLDREFLSRMSRLTGLAINVFSNDGLSMGDREDYTRLKSPDIPKSEAPRRLGDQGILINEVKLEKGECFQGVLPLFGATSRAGAVAALLPKNVVKANTWQMIRLLGIVYLACILILIPVIFIFAGSITKPIDRIILVLTGMVQKLGNASGHVSASSNELATGASDQAASLEEMSSSLEEMSAVTRQNATRAREAEDIMKTATRIVSTANGRMSALSTSMNEISKASQDTSRIIKNIDGIAFQTNLLALNAAVEAARAGEAGAGFAVVADEVRNLAMRAAEAARNTAEMIEKTVTRVAEGSELLGETADAFSQVDSSAEKGSQLVSEIAVASDEQAQGIEQLNNAAVQVDGITQQNAANAEESASASEEMKVQSEELAAIVDRLVELVGGVAKSKKSHEGADDPDRYERSRSSRVSQTALPEKASASQ